jgi:alpha-L-rhamnosidase
MFSSYVQWFYQGLAGIHVDGDAVGCDRVTIRPYLSRVTDRVDASFETVKGPISVSWERLGGGEVRLRVGAPKAVRLRVLEPVGYRFSAEDGADGLYEFAPSSQEGKDHDED